MRLLGLFCVLAIASCKVVALEKVWQQGKFAMPESVVLDNQRQQIYVSNVNQGIAEQDGNGSISLLSKDGKVIDKNWITGLHSPKGLALHQSKLFVADVGQLVIIDLEVSSITAIYPAESAKTLNGVTVSQQGDVYVSDWLGNQIYQLKQHQLQPWISSDKLNSPNGLWVREDKLLVASWGANPKSDFSTESSGLLLEIDISTKKINRLPLNQWINMDGVELDQNGDIWVSDLLTGKLHRFSNSGQWRSSTVVEQGIADFYLDNKTSQVIVPNLLTGQVASYQLP